MTDVERSTSPRLIPDKVTVGRCPRSALRAVCLIALVLAALAIGARFAFPQAISNPSNPTNNPNQINVTTSYLYLNKLHYAGTWSGAVTYNSQDVVLYSSAAYISLQVANLNQNPASASLYWVVLPGTGGSSVWGGISGTLSNQTDLATALAGKQASLGFTPLNAASNLSDLGSASTARTNLGLGTAAVATGPAGAIVGTTDTQTLTNKSISGSQINSGTLPHAQLPTLLTGDIPSNAANTTGNAATATALASTPTPCSTGSAPTGVLANGNSTGCAVLPTSSFAASLGVQSAATMTGSPVALFGSGIAAPALAAGNCYMISVILWNNAASWASTTPLKITVDGTAIQTISNGGGGAGYFESYGIFSYCNGAASQTAQTIGTIGVGSSYCASAALATNCATWNSNGYSPVGTYATPTGVNWSTGHTFNITGTLASGTVTGTLLRVGQ